MPISDIRCMSCNETRPSGKKRRAKTFLFLGYEYSTIRPGYNSAAWANRKLIPLCSKCRDQYKKTGSGWKFVKLRDNYKEFYTQEILEG